MKIAPFRPSFVAMIGNFLEHYDQALFGLLAPFIAPLFFPPFDPITALILTYGILPAGLITRPLGALFFGWIGDHLGRKQALFFSLFGMALVTVGIGCLPTYNTWGSFSPLLLTLGRMLQSFFAAGESVGGAIFVLEHTKVDQKNLVSSLYDLSSMLGILFASSFVTFFSFLGYIEPGWRILFWMGAFTAFLGVFLRRKAKEGKEFLSATKKDSTWKQKILEHKKIFLSLIFVSGLSHMTYALVFTFMNGYIPLITKIPKEQVIQMTTAFLAIDMVLLPLFGYLSGKVGKEKWMYGASFSLGVGVAPLFLLLKSASFFSILAALLWFVLLGASFSAPYYAWAVEKVSPEHRYTVISLASSLGSQLLGAPTSLICLWLYQKTGWSMAPSFYVMFLAFSVSFLLRKDRALGEAKTEAILK